MLSALRQHSQRQHPVSGRRAADESLSLHERVDEELRGPVWKTERCVASVDRERACQRPTNRPPLDADLSRRCAGYRLYSGVQEALFARDFIQSKPDTAELSGTRQTLVPCGRPPLRIEV